MWYIHDDASVYHTANILLLFMFSSHNVGLGSCDLTKLFFIIRDLAKNWLLLLTLAIISASETTAFQSSMEAQDLVLLLWLHAVHFLTKLVFPEIVFDCLFVHLIFCLHIREVWIMYLKFYFLVYRLNKWHHLGEKEIATSWNYHMLIKLWHWTHILLQPVLENFSINNEGSFFRTIHVNFNQ